MKPSTSNPTLSNFSIVIPQTILTTLRNILQYDFYTVQNFTFNFYNVIYGKSAMQFAQCEVGLQYVQVDFSRLLLFMFDPLLHFSTLPSPLSLPCICTESECDSCGTEICINEKHHTNIELENIVENCSTNRLFQIGVLLTHLSSPSKSNMYVVRLRYTRYWNPPHNFPAFSCEHSKNCLSNNF